LWFGLLPVLLAGVAFRYLVPSYNGDLQGALAFLAELGVRYPTLVAVALYLLFAGLVRYWAPWLPGAAEWLPLRNTQPFARKELLLWAGLLSLAVVGALGLRTWCRPYRVLSASMLPTLEPGAHLVTNNAAYAVPYLGGKPRVPKRGDVVVFKKELGPGFPDELVKRVIGLPGDQVEVKGGFAFINGWKVPTCDAGLYVYASLRGLLEAQLSVEFLGERAYLTLHTKDDPGPNVSYTVQPGEVFVLGDNRNNSSDSRAWNRGRGGGLPIADIRGRADRLLVGVKRSGDVDLHALLRPLGVELELEGLDGSQTRSRVDACLRGRPKETEPPLVSAEAAQARAP
jgi:signal peptidase I